MRRAALTWRLTLALVVGTIGEQAVYAQQAPDTRVADLVRDGRVRVGMALIPVFATMDAATGELRGPAIELGRALAGRLGVELSPVAYPSPPRLLDGLKGDAWDVGFLGIDPARLSQVDFSPPYLQIDATYLVPSGSSIRNVVDADQPGVRIAVTRSSAEDIALSRTLKRADVLRVEHGNAAFDLLRTGAADAYASARPVLLQHSARLPGSRVLEDYFDAFLVALAVPKGHSGRLAYVSDFIEEAKASGLVQRTIDGAGLQGVKVAPPGNPSRP